MRPCQQCNGPLGNNELLCPSCGANQQPTVGFLKGRNAQSARNLCSDSHHDLDDTENEIDFDTSLAASACGIAAMAVVAILALAHPIAAMCLFTGCTVAVMLFMSVIGGGPWG